MRKALLFIVVLVTSFSAMAQQDEIKRLQELLKIHPQEDTFRINRLLEIVDPLTRNDKEEADKYSDEAIAIAIKIGYSDGEAYAMLAKSRIKSLTGKTAEGMALVKKADSIAKKSGDNHMKTMVLLRYSNVHSNLSSTDAITYGLSADSLAAIVNDNQLSIRVKINMAELMYVTSDYAKALQYANEMLKILEKYDCQPCLVTVWNTFSNVYIALGQYDKSTAYLNKIMELNKKTGGTSAPNASMSNSIGENYRLSGKYAEAMTYYRQALNTTKDAYLTETAESNMADVYVHMDSLPLAFEYAFRAMEGCIKLEDLVGIAWIDGILSRAYLKKNMTDSALYHAKHGLETARQIGVVEYLRDNAKALADAYVVKKNYEQAYQYQNLYINYRDSMINSEVKNKIAVLEYNTELEKKQGEISVLSQQKKAQQNFLIAVSVVLLSILITAIALLRNNQQKQRAYAKLEAAQAQLVQSEKMASLGELTAGIAHEIQNPLNFVNNFSEVNNELIEEVKIHNNKVKNQNYPEIDELLSDIFSNNEKIAHHGRRADSIVKGMLQHSRNSTGHKELSDINNIADEYLRLSYHGYRAKEKAFNATLKTDFDNNIGKITIIPQDIGRVLLNMFNNAFYAVNEKANRKVNGYEPAVSLSTKKTGHKIEIKVSDNGNGIPQAVVEKIFQPFFTTKPAGEGTGLGLSLAYDIVTKGHGGEMKVETKEGEGTTFTIVIPA